MRARYGFIKTTIAIMIIFVYMNGIISSYKDQVLIQHHHSYYSRYRIVNPGKVAEQYCTLLKTCLEVEDSWGAAANALEYAVRMNCIE